MYCKIDSLSMGKRPDANCYWSNEIQFRAQPSMLKCIEDLVEELKEVSFRLAALPYNKRMSLLSAMETEYEKLYRSCFYNEHHPIIKNVVMYSVI